MGGLRVRVLHISDLHMRSVDGPQAKWAWLEAASRWRLLGAKWAENLAEMCRDGTRVDLVAFTGDLGDWGHPTDYPRAFEFLKQTCAALDVPLDRLFVVPGNHDVDRNLQRTAWESLRGDVAKGPATYSRWLAGDDRCALRGDNRRDLILERQQAFWDALAAELGTPMLAPRHSPHGRLGYRQVVTLPGLSQPLHVIGFDTAWLAGDDGDTGQLRLTEHQISLLATTEAGQSLPGFRLALMHHRLSDLADGADARRLMVDRVDVLLHGHQHELVSEVLAGPDHQLLVLATGCLYVGDEGHHFPNACQVIDLAFDEYARPRSAEVRGRGWSERSTVWGDDALLYDGARNGRILLQRAARGWHFVEDSGVEQAHANASTDREASASPTPPPPSPFKTLRDSLLSRFAGRERELALLDEWLLGPGEVAWVVVTGGPGMGKSTILAEWLRRRAAVSTIVPHHFIVRNYSKSDQPGVIATSLATQIEAAYPALRDPAAAPEVRLFELLDRLSERLGAAGRLVIVVDGLDEVSNASGDNSLTQFLPHVVPAGMRFLCATAPTYPLSWVMAHRGVRRIDLDDPQWAESNRAAVRGFWEKVAVEYQPPLTTETIEVAIERAEGNLLHATMLHDAWQTAPASERSADRIPPGLRDLFGGVWDRATAGDENVRVGLGLLCAAQEGLSLDLLGALARWNHDEQVRVLGKARQLLLEEPASWGGVEAYRPRHNWVRELMATRLGASTMRVHHQTLSAQLASWPAPADAIMRRYALRHALIHREEAGNWEDSWRVAGDLSFLEAQCRELGPQEAEVEMTRLAERCRTGGDNALRIRTSDLARALTRESHWLRIAPDSSTALVWNRLRQLGWSVEELDRRLTVPSGASFLRVRHVDTRESAALVRNLKGHTNVVKACAVTPDNRHVVSASTDLMLKLWDLASGRTLATLEGHTSVVNACVVTPDGRCVISASSDKTVKIWDLTSGHILGTLEGHNGVVNACAVTPDGRHVVSASDDSSVMVWELASGCTKATLRGHTSEVRACAVTPDGRHVVSGSSDKTLRIWDLTSGDVLATLAGHNDAVNACVVTPDGLHVVSASDDRTLMVWELASGRAITTLNGHIGKVMACAVTPDGLHVVSASWDQTLKIWDLADGHVVTTLEAHEDGVNACVVTPNGRYVISASYDKALKVWEAASGRAVPASEGHTYWVVACATTPDGQRAVSASYDKSLKVWDLKSGRVCADLKGHDRGVNACAVTPDGRQVISASLDCTLKVWDVASGNEICTLKGHSSSVNACAVTPDGLHVVSASYDKSLRVWKLADQSTSVILEGHTSGVNGCAVTPDGRHVVSASSDQTLKVWDITNGRVLATLDAHTDAVTACAVTPDGRRVISASLDRTLRIWDLAQGKVIATLEGHADVVRACAVTPDGRHLVSSSSDLTIKVWSLGAPYACRLTHRGNAQYVGIAVTGTVVVAGDTGCGVWILDMPPSYCSEEASDTSDGIHQDNVASTLSLTARRVSWRDSLGSSGPRDLPASLFAHWRSAHAAAGDDLESLRALGGQIGRWLNGSERWLSRLAPAPSAITLTIEADVSPDPDEEMAVLMPWELVALHRGSALTVLRRLGPAAPPPPPSPLRLSVVLVVAAPGGTADLDLSAAELPVRRVAADMPMDLTVAPTGTLEGLGEILARVGPADVIQLVCPTSSRPAVTLEDARGAPAYTTAAEMTIQIGAKPRLMLVFAVPAVEDAVADPAAGGQITEVLTPESQLDTVRAEDEATGRLAIELCGRGWPAVLVWYCRAADPAVLPFLEVLYRQLAQRVALVDAFTAASEAAGAASSHAPAMHQARLFLGPAGGGALTSSDRARGAGGDALGTREFLDPATRQLLVVTDQPFRHRRALVQVMSSLRERAYNGMVVYGGSVTERVTFLWHVLAQTDRERSRVVVARDFDAPALLRAIEVQTAFAKVSEVATQYRQRLSDDADQLQFAVRQIIEGPCQLGRPRRPDDAEHSRAIMLVVHDVGPVDLVRRQPDTRGQLPLAQSLVVAALIRAFAGAQTDSWLMFTCEAPFAAMDGDDDLAGSLDAVSLGGPT